jgi:hypothetical protein
VWVENSTEVYISVHTNIHPGSVLLTTYTIQSTMMTSTGIQEHHLDASTKMGSVTEPDMASSAIREQCINSLSKPPKLSTGMRNVTGFDLYRKKEQDRMRADPDKNFKLTVDMPIISRSWKSLSEDDRMEFKSRAKKCEMVKIISRKKKNVPVVHDKKKKRKRRDLSLPKRPLSAFMFFSRGRRITLKQEQPQLKPTEFLKIMGSEWNILTNRTEFQDMADTDKIRYKDAMAGMESTQA